MIKQFLVKLMDYGFAIVQIILLINYYSGNSWELSFFQAWSIIIFFLFCAWLSAYINIIVQKHFDALFAGMAAASKQEMNHSDSTKVTKVI